MRRNYLFLCAQTNLFFEMIRPIAATDNPEIAQVIRHVLIEFNAPKEGTAYADDALGGLYENYLADNCAYFVVEINGKICGGAGIAPLENKANTVCELQKMYFLPEIRGKGFGQKLMQICLDFAQKAGFKHCYIETLPNMTNAQKLYLKSGFEYINQPMGNTGHHACDVWMIKDLM